MKVTIDKTDTTALKDGERNGETVRLNQSTTHDSRALLCETHRSQGHSLVLRHRYPLDSTFGPTIASHVVLAHLASYRRWHQVVSENT